METKKIKTANGTIIHYWNGKMHNWDGPAYIPEGKTSKGEYYLFGIKHTKDEWLEKKRDVNGQPFYKTSVGKQAGSRV
jgi:hypothetical protein